VDKIREVGMSERLFTPSELEELGVETVDLVEKAINEGDLQKAKKLNRRMYKEFYAMHEGFRDWIATLMSYIQKRMGDEALYEALIEVFQDFVELSKAYSKENPKRQGQMLAAGFRGHLTPLKVEEDDEKITVTMTPCGSGGRAILGGLYEAPKNLARIKKAQKMTFGKKDVPVYCAHCSLQDIIPMEATGYPIWVIDPPDEFGKQLCRYHIYKDPDKIPARYYERYGLKKPVKKQS
jgi:hypothetical protein